MSGFLDTLFLFVTTAFPKAGIQLGDLPLTLNLVLLAILLLSGFPTALKALGAFRGVLPWFAFLVMFGVSSTLIAWQEGAPLYSVAQRITVMVSPLAAVATFRLNTRRSLRIVALAMIVTSAYALVQFAIGVTASSVSGLTYTMGQDLASKPIGYMADDSAAKIPSTYQNGSNFGIFAALAVMLMLTWRPESRSLRRWRSFATVSGVVGLLLCGSRSIIIPIAVSLIFVVHQYLATFSRTRQQRAIMMLIAAILCGAAFLVFFRSDILDAFWQRNAIRTINDPTASGRTNQWSDTWLGILNLNDWQLIRLILFGQSPSWGFGGEGFPEFLVTLPKETLLIQEPQTVFFVSDSARDQFRQRMAGRDNLRVVVRDQESYDTLKCDVAHLYLSPDCAHMLGSIEAPEPTRRAVVLLRRDSESALVGEPVVRSEDWLVPRGSRKLFIHLHSGVAKRLPGELGRILNPSRGSWKKIAERRVAWGVDLLASGEIVVTDRLHAMILALQMGRRVIAIDNKSRKLSRYVDTWFEGVGANVVFTSSLSGAMACL